MELEKLLGKTDEELEDACGFTHYLELEDWPFQRKHQDHTRVVDAFLAFVGKKKMQVVKTDNGVLLEIVDVSGVDLREQLLLLEKNQGMFYDEDITISYAFVGERFYAYINSNMLMFSGCEETVQKMAQVLQNYELWYREPEMIPQFESPSPKILQLKITLEGIEPKIWRRVLVADTLTFHGLHVILQRVMGWGNFHAYVFTVGSRRIVGTWDVRYPIDTMMDTIQSKIRPFDSVNVLVDKFLIKEDLKFSYMYDTKDLWRHTVVVEKVLPRDERDYPIVLDGARGCPPENCGGVKGYKELLAIQKNPSHPLYHERILKQFDGVFDPEYFDAATVNRGFHAEEFSDEPYEPVKLQKLGRNDPCYCGSGKKYKKCCLEKDRKEIGQGRKIPLESR
ncbi:MAG: SEC-C metal-binding domain-containing protein [Methanobacteriota archaeon]